MTKLRHLAILVLFITTFGDQTVSRPLTGEESARTTHRLETYLAGIEEAGFSGSVLVAVNGEIILSKGYGFRDVARGLRNTPATIFDIGSVTKQFTAAGILTLETQGKLATTDRLSKYFLNAPPDKANITLHQLLRHSSGLPSVIGGDYDTISQSGFIDSVMRAPLKFASGTRMSYSNIGYSLLAIIIEKVSGQSYEQYIYDNLWRPAHMETTGYSRPRFDTNMIATGYRREQEWGKPTAKRWDKDAPYWHLKGNGGVLSTTEDLLRWDLALHSDSILTRREKAKYYHPDLRADEDSNGYYAYGWDVHTTKRNTRLVNHNGSNGVFYADFFRYIDEGVTIIVLINRFHPNFVETGRVISRLIFEPAYEPVIPAADNERNRAFTTELMRIACEEGADAAATQLNNRPSGMALIEYDVNVRGYDLLAQNKLKQAIDVFTLNVIAYPRSANAYDSLGEAYMAANEKALSVENYRKSLLLDPDNRNASEMLTKLTGK